MQGQYCHQDNVTKNKVWVNFRTHCHPHHGRYHNCGCGCGCGLPRPSLETKWCLMLVIDMSEMIGARVLSLHRIGTGHLF